MATTTATITTSLHGSLGDLKFYPGAIKGSRRRQRPENASVHFQPGEVTGTVFVDHIDDLPGEMIWYSRDEYDEIKGRNSQIVRLIKAGEFEENEDLSCRGLEHKLKEVFRQRRANKFNALNAVLEEQDRQMSRGIVDDVLISAAYQTVSVRCQESANTIAVRDYRYSLNYCPKTPATGKASLHDNKLGDSASGMSKDKDKKKKKKDKKEKEKKDKDKKDKDKKDKHKHKDKDKDKDKDEENDEEDDDPLSPHKKKKGVRKMARGARRMMRRMSM